jgi:membrane-associated phospholipid phosphatase
VFVAEVLVFPLQRPDAFSGIRLRHFSKITKEQSMDSLISFGIALVASFQSLGGWLEVPMKIFSFLGSEDFFLFFLPLVYWCIDANLGLRIGFILLAGNGLNDLFKLAMHGPRPYWVSTTVQGMASETSFGVPSGHSQIAAGIWGTVAAYLRKGWAWGVALLVILLIGLSRLYLGVHFPHDVLLGWTLGFLTLWAFVKFWDPVAARLKKLTMGRQMLVAFAVSLGMILLGVLIAFLSRDFVLPAEWVANATRGGEIPDPLTLSGIFTAGGTLFGLAAGVAWLSPRGGYRVSGPAWMRAVCYLVGLVGVVVFYFGLKLVFPSGDDLVGLLFRYVRYTFVGAWVSAGAPWVFTKLKIGNSPSR